MLIVTYKDLLGIFKLENEMHVYFSDIRSFRLTMLVISKFGVTAALVVVQVYLTELVPTVLRGVSVGTAAAFGHTALLFTHYLFYLVRKTQQNIVFIQMYSMPCDKVWLYKLSKST